jgi:hypothetical protein
VRALAALVASLWLPAGGTFSSVQPAGSFLFLSGSADRGSACISTRVSLAAFEASRTRIGRCSDPAHRTSFHVVFDSHSPWQAVVLSTGTVLFTYEDASDTRPVSAYGGGFLWVYDVWTRKGARLAQVSASTGRIVRMIAMPPVFRPLMAADEDGVWLVPAANGGVAHGPAPVLHVPVNGAPSIVHLEGRAAMWLTAHAHTVWTEIVTGASTRSLWRFDGPKARATKLATPKGPLAPWAVVWGAGKLWTVVSSTGCRTDRVVTIDPRTGALKTVARVAEVDTCDSLAFDPQGLAFAGGALYFLDEPKLYRIRP